MLLLGIDLGTSSVKVTVLDAVTQKAVASVQYPETEADIISLQPGWAEQSPDLWWEHVKQAILKCHATKLYDTLDIAAIGIAYQMHGLVLVDKDQHVLRNSIIWCDSRAVAIGDEAFANIGTEKCLYHLLNSPGNFTASKLAWVKENEPALFEKIDKAMLPGDFIAMKLTGSITTTTSALSEGIFWDYRNNSISKDIIDYFGFDESVFPAINNLFSSHGILKDTAATRLSLKPGIPVSYKAGDQPNNALSLNVLQPGEVAATAGTSGVIYGVSDQLEYDQQSRINSFAHVNHQFNRNRIGILLCINSAGIFNRWIKNLVGASRSYSELNHAAAVVAAGANGLMALPFGNGAERMLNNKVVGAHFQNLDFNIHTEAHLVRAAQEGVAFAFRYGLDIMRENGMQPSVIRAGRTNLFLSDVFTNAFVNSTQVPVEFYEGDGSYGAAIGAGIGAGIFKDTKEAFGKRKPVGSVEPGSHNIHEELYQQWKGFLKEKLSYLQNENELINIA
ncbi:MAG TPA: FGGY family carbohydrate kinase [Ferruginibacter sp.]|nr:FGGY family carbohydrate kinase [Ferruginibacter sp.]